MGRKQRKRQRNAKEGDTPAAMRRPRRQLIPWRERARQVLTQLREFARDRAGDEIEAFLQKTFGENGQEPDVHDLQRAFDDYVCAVGSAGENRSLVRAFVEESGDLQVDERDLLKSWEQERRRRVFLLDRCTRDRIELWAPLAGGREVLHLIEKMPPARAAALKRGTVVIATSAPFGSRKIVVGQMEIYEGDDAIEMYRAEVRDEGRIWHDMPPPAPVA